MSISSDLTRIKHAKSAIITSITNKGVTVPSGTKIDGLAALINKIPTGATRQTPASLGYAQSPYLFFFDGQYPLGGYAKPNVATPLSGVIGMENGISMSANELNVSSANYFSTYGNATKKYRKYDVSYAYSCYPLATQFTFEMTLSFNSSPSYAGLWGVRYVSRANSGWYIEATSTTQLSFVYYNSSGTKYTVNATLPSAISTGKVYCLQIRYSSDYYLDIYFNGSRISHKKLSPSLTLPDSGYKYRMSIGGQPADSTSPNTQSDTSASNINIFSARLHTNLTDASLTQNYNKDKARFGIT